MLKKGFVNLFSTRNLHKFSEKFGIKRKVKEIYNWVVLVKSLWLIGIFHLKLKEKTIRIKK